MSEYSFDQETVDAALAASVAVHRVVIPGWASGAPEHLRRLTLAGVVPDESLTDILARRVPAHSSAWFAGTHEDGSSPWAIIDVTFESGVKKSLRFDLKTQAEPLRRVAEGGELFIFDDAEWERAATTADVLEVSVLVAQGGSEALRRQLDLS